MSGQSVTVAFVDMATYDELEVILYGGDDATAYFVRETRKSTWFSIIPVQLTRSTGTADFGQQWSSSISRAGDYLLSAWLRIGIPAVTLAAAGTGTVVAGSRLRWTRNLGHNIISECTVSFNDLVAARFDNYFLDFWAAFTVDASKQVAYDNMIGNVPELTSEQVAPGATLPARMLNVPLPFWFCRDSGVALPTAALPYNEMRINFNFRGLNELLVHENSAVAVGTSPNIPYNLTDIVGTAPTLNSPAVWGEYAIVSNDERQRMGCAARDIVIEQAQTAPVQTFTAATAGAAQSVDIRFSHAVKALFFGARNKTIASDWSNYTAASADPSGANVNYNTSGASDPILQTSLVYENSNRLNVMGSDYFSLVNPYYHAPVVPTETGYHCYSYALDFCNLDPQGSTNYGRLTNVSISPSPSAAAVAGNGATGATKATGQDYVQTYDFICVALAYNVIRISGGALGFPIL